MDSELAIQAPATAVLSLPPRHLLGAGPSTVHPRVYSALSTPIVGHLDPSFLKAVVEMREMLRYVFQTKNEFTVALSGPGSAAMEASIADLTLPDDRVLVFVCGYFGDRMYDMATRYSKDVRRVDAEWGSAFTLDEIKAHMAEHRPNVVCIVHAETSTGVLQDLRGVGDVCREYDALLVVDTVTSLGGVPLLVDEWKIDAAFAGCQKCISCPPGVSPLTYSPRAHAKLMTRYGEKKIKTWCADLTMMQEHLDTGRPFHYTAPVGMVLGFREALQVITEEGLATVWARHRNAAERLWAGLQEMGLELHVPEQFRLHSLTTIRVPEGINAPALQGHLIQKFNLEISGGLGKFGGKVWRIGLMGYGARDDNVDMVLAAMRSGLEAQGYTFPVVAKAEVVEFPEVTKHAADAGFSVHDADGESETFDE